MIRKLLNKVLLYYIMDKKIPTVICIIGVSISLLSLIFTLMLFANWGGPGQWRVGSGDTIVFSAFILFFLAYNFISLVVFSKAKKEIMKYTLFGTLVCINMVSLHHLYSLLMTLIVGGDWGFLWWSILTLIGIPIGLAVGGILGFIFTKIKNK